MKNQLLKFIALCAIVCGFTGIAHAQSADNVKPATLTPEQRSEQRSQQRLNKMKTNLNLTDAQLPKVKKILDAEATASNSCIKQVMEEGHEKMKSEMGKILTPEQLTKFNQMEKEQAGKTQTKSTNSGSGRDF